MQADYNGGFTLVDGPAPLLHRMYEVIKAADIPPSAAVKEHLKERKWATRRDHPAPDGAIREKRRALAVRNGGEGCAATRSQAE